MNLADYLSELLGLHNEVNVPGLGYFVRNRINAYYNEKEARFYPPYHQVKFVPQPNDDETFARYVADKKNISLASSKYFVEKFITKLKEDASQGKFLFADLGSFQSDMDQLIFKPNERIPADPAFYGYPPLDIFKATQPLQVDMKKPVLAPDQPASTPAAAAVFAPPPAHAINAPDYYEEEVEQKRGVNVWLIVLIVAAVLGLAVFGVYKFYPQAFDKVKDEYNKITGKTADSPAVIRHEVKSVPKETAKKAAAPIDTASKTVTTAAKPDSVKLPTFLAIAEEVRSQRIADQRVAHLKSVGLDAYIVPNTIGPLKKIAIGQPYATYGAADSVELMFIKQKIIFKHHPPYEVKP